MIKQKEEGAVADSAAGEWAEAASAKAKAAI